MSKKKKSHYKKKGNVVKHLTSKILKQFYKNTNKPLNYKQIAAGIGISDAAGKQQIIQKIQELVINKRIEQADRGSYKIVLERNYYTGTIDVTIKGHGYFICEELEKDIFIPNINLNKALDNDLVKAYVYTKKRSHKQEAEVVEVIERAKKEFVGVLQLNKNFGFVLPDNIKMYADIFIPLKKINGAEHGDKVVAKITDWPEKSKNPFGKITTVLGKPGDHDTEIHSILLEYDLPYEFEDGVEQDAANLPIEITAKDISERRDMRKVTTFTIDPKDAKDFDDALSFQILENGNYEVGIHIADVSHYVQEGTILEDEAYKRATSVYLVDRVVPMLPEILSNNVCSLRPHEEKLTFSAIFEIDKNTKIINQWFGRTVIYSDARFAYEEAQHIIEMYLEAAKNNLEINTHAVEIPSEISLTGKSYKVASNIVEATIVLDKLAKKLRAERMRQGAITFDRTEVRFSIDEDANPTGIYFKTSKDANKLIEEFMLLANRKVAEFIGMKNGKITNNTFIYRVHDQPDSEKLSKLQNIISKFGYKINTDNRATVSSSLNTLLENVKGKGEANMIETLTIRTMSKAIYTTQNIGHYGLAFNYYSHFTSPIRRYPDVMTHRLLQHYLDGGKSPSAAIYEEKCKHSSNREMLASKAERSSIKYMQVKYMQNHKDEVFEGVISGVTEWGIYVEINKNKCEGMIRIKDIKDDYYLFDEKQYALVGQSTGNLYQLGATVHVKVKNTDLERKHLDFWLMEALE